jgi:hypothetical protein
MKLYEVGIYNKFVRERLRIGEDPPQGLSEEWDEVHYFDIKAENETQAITKALFAHPAKSGFVVECCNLYK